MFDPMILTRQTKFGFRALKRFLSSNVAANFLSLSGSTVVTNLIGLITLGYSARVLGPTNYGLVVYGSSVAAYAGILLSPGLLRWGTRTIAQDKGKAGEYLIVINTSQLVLASFGYACLALYSTIFLSGAEKTIVLLSGLNLFITAINIDFVYSGLELMRVTGLLGVVSAILNTIGLLTLIRLPEHAFRLPILTVTIALTIQLISYVLLMSKYKIRLVFPAAPVFGKVLVASFPLGLTSLITIVYSYANNLFVKAFLGIAALGLFYAASRLIEISIVGFQILNSVFLPRLSREVPQNRDAARSYALLYVRILMTLAFLIAPIVFTEAESIVDVIYGTEYVGAVLPLKIMSLVIICASASTGYTGTLIPFSHDKAILKISVLAALSVLLGSPLVIPAFGLVGASLIWIAVNLVGFIAALPSFRREIGTYGLAAWILPLWGAGIIFVCSFVLQELDISVWWRGVLEVSAYLPFGVWNVLPALSRLWDTE